MSGMDILKAVSDREASPQIVMKASVPLELSGEAVRSRICIFTDAGGREWALRPDLTLPVALDEVEARRAGQNAPSTQYYSGPVFRLPIRQDDPVEFQQFGLERFGAPSSPQTDISVLSAICEACQAEGVSEGVAQFGDLSVFPAFVEALDLSDETKSGLKRAFRQEGGVRAFLQADRGGAAGGLAKRMEGMTREEIAAFTQDIFALTGTKPVGERSGDEIIERLYQRAQSAAAADVSDAARGLLTALLDLDVPVGEAASELEAIAKQGGLNGLEPVFETLNARAESLSEEGFAGLMKDARFATRFGRRFTYYDGFVFEIAASPIEAEAGRPFAAGGRYDQLLADLSGGEVTATAIGGAIIPHRLPSTNGARA